MTANRQQLESDIKAALAAGDADAALTIAIEGYGSELLGFLEAIHHHPDDAHEVFARASERMVKGLPGFRGDSSFRTWLYAIVVNESRRQLSSPEKRRVKVGLSAVSGFFDRARTETPAHRRTGPKQELRAFRDGLPAEDRMLLVLRIDRGLSWNEVADMMATDAETPIKKSAAALRKRFERIKDKLAEHAAKEGWSLAR